jgi:hypothetical protein
MTQTLLYDIDVFMSVHGMKPTMFGVLAVNDGHLVRDLRAGTDIRASTIDRVRAFMAAYRPARPAPLGRRSRRSEAPRVA